MATRSQALARHVGTRFATSPARSASPEKAAALAQTASRARSSMATARRAPAIDPALAHDLPRPTPSWSPLPPMDGDPVLRRFETRLAAAPHLRWIGYLSTVGVYGDHDGGWVDETTPPRPLSERSRRRVEAEQAWLDFGRRVTARRCRSSGCPASTAPAATRSSIWRGHGAAHHQAGPGVQPHSCRRYRGRARRFDRPAAAPARSTMSPTTSRPRRRTSWPIAAACWACAPPPEHGLRDAPTLADGAQLLRREQAGFEPATREELG